MALTGKLLQPSIIYQHVSISNILCRFDNDNDDDDDLTW